ncbi:uncharacterized protein LOC144541921 [Centroberyx gerrardi]
MGSKMFSLYILVLVAFIDQSQGIPETDEQPLSVSTVTNASANGESLTTEDSISSPRQHERLCDSKGRRREGMNASFVCQNSAKRYRRPGKLAKKCLRRKPGNQRTSCKPPGLNKGVRKSPSVPI